MVSLIIHPALAVEPWQLVQHPTEYWKLHSTGRIGCYINAPRESWNDPISEQKSSSPNNLLVETKYQKKQSDLLTCPSINESRHTQSVSVRLWVNGEWGVTSKHCVTTEVLHVDQQLVLFRLSQVEEILKTWTHTHTNTHTHTHTHINNRNSWCGGW